MTTLIKTIHNAETGETQEIPLTAKEIADLQAQKEKDAEREIARQAEAEAKVEAKAALLAQLGITAEQAKLLLS
jgi:hypothetical protein